MNRTEALARLPGIERTNAYFSNVNAAKEVWWLDIPVKRIQSATRPSLNLLLYEANVAKLHVLEVPIAFLADNFRSLSVREDKGVVSLELSSVPSRFLLNTRPSNSGLRFSPYLVDSVSVR